MLIVYFIIFLALSVLIHLLATVFFSYLLGLKIERVSYGLGFTVYKSKKFTLRLFPIADSITFKDKSDKQFVETEKRLEDQTKLTRICLALSGFLVLLLISWLILGNSVLTDFFPWMFKILSAPFIPTQEKIVYFESANKYMQNSPLLFTFAKICFYSACHNLMPFTHLAGGRFISEFITNQKILDKIFLATFSYWVVMLFSWIYPLFKYFLIKNAI